VLSARQSENKIHAHCGNQYFLKFNFDRTFVVPLREGSVIHKYMHCSGEYALLFRSVGEDVKVDMNPPTELAIPMEGMHWKLEAKHDRNLVLTEYHQVGRVVKVKAFADAVKDKMVEDAVITRQQKVKYG
jgi:hypothetical protein